MQTILDEKQISQLISKLAQQIADSCAGENDNDIAIIGVRSRGEIIAQRIAGVLAESHSINAQCGTLDITLYRDDLDSRGPDSMPHVRTTDIAFSIDGCVVVLVDDVLHTGRSIRAALDALIDLGRPRAIRLAVLIERSGREFPIQADFLGTHCKTEQGKSVVVNMLETDGRDQVLVE